MSGATVTADDLDAAIDHMVATLAPATGADWSVPAGSLDWTCRDTAAHIAHDLLAYAAQVADRAGDRYLPLDVTVRDTAGPDDVLDVVQACGTLPVRALTLAADGDRTRAGSPRWASTNCSCTPGTSPRASACRGGCRPGQPRPWWPGCSPDHPGADLLWCTGRVALPGRPRRTHWTLRASTGS